MKLTRRTICISGLLVAAALIAIAVRPKKDEIWIQLIDSRTAKPMTNVVVTNLAVYRTPFAEALHLPDRFRLRSLSTVILARNGAFPIQRIFVGSSLESQSLSFRFGKITGGPHVRYTADGIWQYGFKVLQERPVTSFFWAPINSIELLPDHGPVILRINPNTDPRLD